MGFEPQRFGPYVLLWPLKPGGMGDVFVAASGPPGLETICVVKRILPDLRASEEYLKRFRREADLSRRFRHRNLPHTFAVGEAAGEPFIAQEMVEGQDLSEVMLRLSTENRDVPVAAAVHVASEVARALGYLHDFDGIGLVHRDVTPHNVRLTFDGDVKLLDFGLALPQSGERLTAAGVKWGKLIYMAPEQLLDWAIDRRTDIYTLGVVLWEMLTGRPIGTSLKSGLAVLPADDRKQTMDRILSEPVVPPSQINPAVPRELDALVEKAMAKQPADRFQSAAEMRGALALFLPSGAQGEAELGALMRAMFDPRAEREHRESLVEAARPLLAEANAGMVAGAGAAPRRSRPRVVADLTGPVPPLDPAQPARRLGLALGALAGVALGAVGVTVLRGRAAQQVKVEAPAGAQAEPEAQAQAQGARAQPTPAAASGMPAGEPGAAPPAAGSTRSGSAPAPATGDHSGSSPRAGTSAPGPAARDADASRSAARETADGRAGAERARAAFERGDLDGAIRHGESAAARGETAAHAVLGAAYFKLGRYPEAARAYARALEHDPGNATLARRLDFARRRASETTADPGVPSR